jgi:hypothetical protein
MPVERKTPVQLKGRGGNSNGLVFLDYYFTLLIALFPLEAASRYTRRACSEPTADRIATACGNAVD